MSGDLRGKLCTLDALEERAALARAAGERIVLCHGCFDIVHPGHVRHLQHAAKQGDRLVVTVSGDSVIDKGAGRPLIPQELRAENLAALDFVDWVAVSPDLTALEVLERVRPDVYVKGREYEQSRDPRFEAEKAAVERYGGRVLFTSGEVVFSSTALIDAIEESADPFHARLRGLIDQHDMAPLSAERVIGRFRDARVLVVGETILDTYVMCDRPEVAGEAPMMTLRPVEHRRFDGGAAILARHLAAMGARPVLVTALPGGGAAQAIRGRLDAAGVEVRPVAVDQPLIEKQRYLVGTSKVVKIDRGELLVIDSARQRRLLGAISAAARECSGAIIVDYGHGLLSEALLPRVCGLVRPRVRVLAGDVSGRRSNLPAFRDLDLLCPGEQEIRDALHDHNTGLSAIVWRLLDRTRSKAALVTLGGEGMIAFQPEARAAPRGRDDHPGRLAAEHLPALCPYAVDALGCGDAVLAAATLGLVAGCPLVVAAVLGSIAAAAEARVVGNAAIDATELRRGMQRVLRTRLVCQTGAVTTTSAARVFAG